MKFSVLMSVYKAEKKEYLDEALKSLLHQKLKPNELILVEDGPISQDLKSIIKKYKNNLNIISVKIKKNVGLRRALNTGLKFCKNELVARMDSDDISFTNRFKLQVSYMKKNLDIAVSSCYVLEFSDNKTTYVKKLPTKFKDVVKFAKFRNPLSHPAVIFRKSVINSLGGYPDFFPEDYALWLIILKANYKISNLPKVLLKMRTNNDFFNRRGLKFFFGEIKIILFQKKIGQISYLELVIHICIKFFLRLANKDLKIFMYKNFRKVK
jgi:glycosyltransferase involved in cell wall biosynthesis